MGLLMKKMLIKLTQNITFAKAIPKAKLMKKIPVTLFPIEVKSDFVVIANNAKPKVAATVAKADKNTVSGV